MTGRSPFEAVAQDGMGETAYTTDELSHPEYVNDDFRMFTFKVMKCPKRYVHDWRSCPFAHPTENARRRDPRELRYMPVPCPDYKRGLCLMGDACTYSHGVYECWLHPAKYRTQLCKDGAQCRRPVCFFAHSVSELRSPTYTWDSSEDAVADGKQVPLGLPDGALPQGAPGHGGHHPGQVQGPNHMNYPNPGHDHNGSQAFHYQPQDRHQPLMPDHLDPSQPSMGYPYPPAQHHVPYMDPYYAPHPNPNPGMDGYGLSMHMISNPQMPNPNHRGFNSPFQAPGVPRMYPQPPRLAMEAPGMAGMPHTTPYQREQQRLHSMHRYHSQQLSEQQHQQQQQQQQQQHQIHRQPSGPAPAGSLPPTSAATARSGAPSADLGELLSAGGGQGTTAPRMSNAMARSLGLVPPKETRTRTLGALAGLIQGPRATSLTDGVNRPQMSYSLPAQLPDPDQHMHKVYLTAQAAAAGNGTQGPLSQSTQRQASMGMPPSMGSGGTMSSGLSQTVRQASLGLPQGPGTIGPATRQSSQGSLGLAPSGSLGTAQRQGSLGRPQSMGQGNLGLPYEPSPQDLQAWQRGLQQGIKGAQASQQKGSGQLDGATGLPQTAQSRLVMEQLQRLGLFADGDGNLNSGQLQGLVTMLSKQGMLQKYGHTPSSLAGQTIPEAEQVAGASVDDHALATLLNSFQNMGVTSTQPPKKAQPEQKPQGGGGQTHVASPFASPDHAPPLDFCEGGDSKAVGGMRKGSNQPGQLSARVASLASSSSSGPPQPQAMSANRASHSPFASPNQQLHKVSSNSSGGSMPGRSPSGHISQATSQQASSPLPSPHTSAVN